MKILSKVILVILVFLAVLSGVTKIMLMPQDVAFFSAYGFTDPILMAFGAVQVLGGVLLLPLKTRFVGAALVEITFVISAGLLFLSGNIPMALVTLVFVALLSFVALRAKMGLD